MTGTGTGTGPGPGPETFSVGHWSLVIGYRSSVIGHWSLGFFNREVPHPRGLPIAEYLDFPTDRELKERKMRKGVDTNKFPGIFHIFLCLVPYS